MSHVIQFSQLEQFVAEVAPLSTTVRVVALETKTYPSRQIPTLRRVRVGVHCRALTTDGHIYACYLPVGELELFNGRRASDPLWQRYDEVWQSASGLCQRVSAYLIVEEIGVRNAGVIDIGDTQPLPATWRSDPQHMEARP